MKKYLLGIIAAFLAVSFTVLQSFNTVPKDSSQNVQTTYNWYVVDYNIPGGIIPSGAQVVLSNKTVAEATALDGCTDTYNLHCLRGFSGTPPAFPTASYDQSTPKP